MNKNILKLVIVSVVLFTTNATQAYRWNMRNDTDDILLMQAVLDGYCTGCDLEFYYIVLPKSKANNVAQYADFDWTGGNTRAGFCLKKLLSITVDTTLYAQLLKDNIIKEITETINGVQIKKPVIVDNARTTTWFNKNTSKKFEEVTREWSTNNTSHQRCSNWNNLEIKKTNGKVAIQGKS